MSSEDRLLLTTSNCSLLLAFFNVLAALRACSSLSTAKRHDRSFMYTNDILDVSPEFAYVGS
jgi:hypothetical protein